MAGAERRAAGIAEDGGAPARTLDAAGGPPEPVAAAAPATAAVAGAAIGRSARRPIARPHDGQKWSSLPWIAAQRGHAAMPASRRTVSGRLSPSASSSARNSVSIARERRELRGDELVAALAEALHLEDETPEVAVGELARLAQEAQPAAHAAARAEARAARLARAPAAGRQLAAPAAAASAARGRRAPLVGGGACRRRSRGGRLRGAVDRGSP